MRGSTLAALFVSAAAAGGGLFPIGTYDVDESGKLEPVEFVKVRSLAAAD